MPAARSGQVCTGTSWEGRFKSRLVDSGRYVLGGKADEADRELRRYWWQAVNRTSTWRDCGAAGGCRQQLFLRSFLASPRTEGNNVVKPHSQCGTANKGNSVRQESGRVGGRGRNALARGWRAGLGRPTLRG